MFLAGGGALYSKTFNSPPRSLFPRAGNAPDDAASASTTSPPGDLRATRQDRNKSNDIVPMRNDTRSIAGSRTAIHEGDERPSKDRSTSSKQATHSLEEGKSNGFLDRGRSSNQRGGNASSLGYDYEGQENRSDRNNNTKQDKKNPGLFSRMWTKLFGKREPESDLNVEMIEELHMVTGCKSGMHACTVVYVV